MNDNAAAAHPTMSEKRANFERLAKARTVKIIKGMRLLANMGGKARYSYEFSREDIDHIAGTLEVELKQLREKMISPGRQLDVEFDFK